MFTLFNSMDSEKKPPIHLGRGDFIVDPNHEEKTYRIQYVHKRFGESTVKYIEIWPRAP